jgi:hypothetical protein
MVLGYVTAINAQVTTGPSPHDVTRGTDAEGLFAWIDNYCRTNPLDTLSRATGSLIDALQLRK